MSRRRPPSLTLALTLVLTCIALALRDRLLARDDPGGRDRGDVPGWVLITVMTAGLVTALWIVADPKLSQIFNDALDSVHG